MKQKNIFFIALALSAVLLATGAFAAPLLDANEIGFGGQVRGDNYETLLNAMFTSNNVVTTINGNLWVPWFKTSSSSERSDLHSGSNCNSGQTIDFTHNCMVTDEFSQVGLLVSMGKYQSRMDEFYNALFAIKSTNGNLPSWIVYRDGNTIQACNPAINVNCDTASDADARIVTALFTASKNQYFTDETQKAKYAALARNIADDILNFETEKTCRPTMFGIVCNWLAGGSVVKNSGIGANDFAYTGYYPDAIIAMLAAYSNTNDVKYLTAAKDFTANYLQAAKFNGQVFTAPPGKSFKWVVDASGQPQAQCTNICSPDMWDEFDASRALGMCQANYYASQMGVQLHNLQQYCNILGAKHMSNPASAPIQFRPDGSAGNSQSGYFPQGLQALHQAGVSKDLFKSTVDNALSHYAVATNTFDYQPSLGVYTSTFAIRALGMGIGRDAAAFGAQGTPPPPPSQPVAIIGIAGLTASCILDTTPCTLKTDITSGSCRTVVWSTASGDMQITGCEKENNVYELYLQQLPWVPSGVTYKSCLDNGCVNNQNGFARFTPVYTTSTYTSISVPGPQPLSAPSVPKTMNSVAVSCSADGAGCTKISDVTSGVCRTIVWKTSSGDIQVLGCDKGSGTAEVYRQAAPGGLIFKTCMEGACVDDYTGFASFRLY